MKNHSNFKRAAVMKRFYLFLQKADPLGISVYFQRSKRLK